MELLRAEGLVKHDGRFRLGPIDMSVSAGDVVAIMGPKDAGKSTVMKLLWGFLRPDKGIVSVFNKQPHLHQVSVRTQAGYVSQTPVFYNWMTPAIHLEFVSTFYDRWDAAHVRSLLYRFDINHPETNGMIEYFVRPMDGVSQRFTFDDLIAYRSTAGTRFRTRPPGTVKIGRAHV